jgi:DNA-binding NtrC family response regulator
MLVRNFLRDQANPPGVTTLKGAGTVLMARATLVFYHRDGTTVAHLERGRAVIVGRSEPADVVIGDSSLSRQHARFTWQDQGGLFIDDLASTNGTTKNGKKIDHTRISPGDDLALGSVRVSVHILSSVEEDLRGFDGHDRFIDALGDEITRARTFSRPLPLLMVRGSLKDGHVNRWSNRLRVLLRPVDRVGVYGPSAVLVSLPEATPEQAQALATELTGGDPPLTTNLVIFPSDGSSVDELLAAVQVSREQRTPPSNTNVVVKNEAMKEVMATVKRLARSAIAVLINGETGTGKEVIARAIHDAGPRKKQPLLTVNCGAIPATLIEGTLFGHEQGAFTGADKAAPGIFEEADGGTVLLDEIGELALPAQAALLRVLETKKLTRVGGTKEIEVDVRVIAATHRDLDAMVEAGRFRQDLLYRLNTMTLKLPPLRERVDEIRPLAERFLEQAAKQSNAPARNFDREALAALEAYPWPGNIRELRNVIERAVVLAEGKTITLSDLTERLRGMGRGASGPTAPPPVGLADGGDYRESVRKFEIDLIVQALERHQGNQTETAKALNLPLRTLVHKIQTYGIKKRFDR